MPVILVGADTPAGRDLVTALLGSTPEVRVFVSDGAAAAAWRGRGIKVALGDVSDGSHLAAAARGCFCAVLLAVAADDDRERAFADAGAETLGAWTEALRDAGVTRVIWVGDDERSLPTGRGFPEEAVVTTSGRSAAAVVAAVLRLEAAARL